MFLVVTSQRQLGIRGNLLIIAFFVAAKEQWLVRTLISTEDCGWGANLA